MKQDKTLTALLWIVAAGFFMQALDTTIVNTALPAMAASLGENPLRMQPVVVSYSLTMALLTPTSGWLADRFGTRRVYFVAIVLFVLGSICCAMAHTLPQLVLARVLQGAGGSMLLPIALARVVVKRMVTPLVLRHGYTRFLMVNTAVVGGGDRQFCAVRPGLADVDWIAATSGVRRRELDAVRRDEQRYAQGSRHTSCQCR